MIISNYLFKYPYKIIWHLLQFFRKNKYIAVYCAEPIDYIIMKPALQYLSGLKFVVKNKETMTFLKSLDIQSKLLPSFPDAVIMSRHAAHKFPEKNIIKIGFRHGAYHFKKFAKSKYYNKFDLFFFTSEYETELAAQAGIACGKAIGFPKLDPAFNGLIGDDVLRAVSRKAGIQKDKKTIIFTSTWDKSGMSAIDKWIHNIHELSAAYNILVTVHSWTSKKYMDILRQHKDIFFIEEPDTLPYMMIADVCIGDYSSIIAEFCALDKPIITFCVEQTKRTVHEITEILETISIRVDDFAQLKDAIVESLNNRHSRSKFRQEASQVMFSKLDGLAGQRAAALIKSEIPFCDE